MNPFSSEAFEDEEDIEFFRLKVELQGLPHECSRVLVVPSDINMRQLHFVIQESFGWKNSHLFDFTDVKLEYNENESQPTIRVGMADTYSPEIGPPAMKEAYEVKLNDTFYKEMEGRPFWYNYDYGDNWWHRISFMETTMEDWEQFHGEPFCVEAVGKCPPEDVGGTSGYTDFLKIVKDEDHPEYAQTLYWCGVERYDETLANIHIINFILERLYASDLWEENRYESY